MSVVPFPAPAPQHIAIVMDGNRRWASQRRLPGAIGHADGARQVRKMVQACSDRGIRYLTLFAFSTENWRRPSEEVSCLMGLFAHYLEKEVHDMDGQGVRLKVVGDLDGFDPRLRRLMLDSQVRTAGNSRITLTIAANYGGRWDMLQATRAWQAANRNDPEAELTEDSLRPHLSMAYAPDPDLIIRTGGEYRISNFLLWQMAYAELHFTETLWPDFDAQALDQAIAWYRQRDRRFGGNTRLAGG